MSITLLLRTLFVLNLALSMLVFAEEPKTETDKPHVVTASSKYGPRDVEVLLTDNSLFRGEADALEAIVLKTAYGTLTIPSNEIIRVTRGTRLEEKELKNLEALIKDLDSDEFAKRNIAQKQLETAGSAAIEPLKKARDGTSAEARTRIDKIVAKLNEKLQGKAIQVNDIVTATRFEAAGILQLNTLKLSSRVGQLNIKIEDLQSIRWLNRGESKLFTLEPNASIGNWVDTGINPNNGDAIAIVASGTINPNPTNNNVDIGPMGTENWGNNNGFLMGTLLAKIGTDGEPFAIGQGKAWTANSHERLFIKIFWNNRQCRLDNNAKGSFKVRVSTGVMAEGIRVPKNEEDSAAVPELLQIKE